MDFIPYSFVLSELIIKVTLQKIVLNLSHVIYLMEAKGGPAAVTDISKYSTQS